MSAASAANATTIGSSGCSFLTISAAPGITAACSAVMLSTTAGTTAGSSRA